MDEKEEAIEPVPGSVAPPLIITRKRTFAEPTMPNLGLVADIKAAGLSPEVAQKIADMYRGDSGNPHASERRMQNVIPPYWNVRLIGSLNNRAMLITGPSEDHASIVFIDRQLANSQIDEFHPVQGLLAKVSTYAGRLSTSSRLYDRLTAPEILLVGLFHPENFPLPRFHLAISDIAYALRSRFYGHVTLMDMQLGVDIDDVVAYIDLKRPQIIGVSATFGQHDKLSLLLLRISEMRGGYTPVVVCGGSLSTLVGHAILDDYPDAVIANGPGERVMADVVASWYGDLPLNQVTDATLNFDGRRITTHKLPNKAYEEGIPELDLLEETLNYKGVMQLESSRGCTYACSFCPRAHKGMWSGYDDSALVRIVEEIGRIYDRHPSAQRRLFLVDEEYVGYREDAQTRGMGVATLVQNNGFTFETSTRVDQVIRPVRDREWHLSRMEFWRNIVDVSLDRCLFGVESGVDSILKRFNKKTTAQQNAQAVRTLTAIGVPIRITYITFDHLMTMDELVASYVFLGRKDIILAKSCYEDFGQLYDTVTDDDASAKVARGLPFYVHVSYMLVTMEPLIGSKYLQELEAEGLAGEFKYSMGCRRASFRDHRIGVLSDLSQRMVDRNFSLDYILKSLQKISSKQGRKKYDRLRVKLKEYYYFFLGAALWVLTGTDVVTSDRCGLIDDEEVIRLRRAVSTGGIDVADALRFCLDYCYARMIDEFEAILDELDGELTDDAKRRIQVELVKSKRREDWSLINA